MNIRFLGARGSIPTPGKAYLKYGGNTPCLEVKLQNGNESVLILDAGTGIRQLGLDLMKRLDRIQTHLLFTHFHWDHLQGIPFFAPLYSERCECTFVGNDALSHSLEHVLRDSVHPPYFPVGFDVFKAKIDFIDRYAGDFEIGTARIKVMDINHPGGAVAYRIEAGGRTFVYMTDNELNTMGPGDIVHRTYIDFCTGADLLVHDAQYTPDEYVLKKGWGHSSYVDAVNLAIAGIVKKLALFHHDPEHDDDIIDDMVKKSRDLLMARNSPIECFGAREGLEVEI